MTPSHAGNAEGITQNLAGFFCEHVLSVDIQPNFEGIDVGEDSPYREAEELAADAWNAHRTWFLAGGASQSNRVAIMAVAGRNQGKHIIAQRSAHSSAIGAIVQAQLLPRFMPPSVDEERGINNGVTPQQVRDAVLDARNEGEPPAAVYVISPSYFGAVADVAGLSAVTRELGVPR